MKQQERIHKELEALLLAAGYPLSIKRLGELLAERKYSPKVIKSALAALMLQYENRALELVRVASGYVFHIREEYADLVHLLTEERPLRYSRALMETLAIIAYKQPVTRAEIEELRGVTLSSNLMRTLLEHEWIRAVGRKEVPGRPVLWATTKHFLDSFKMKELSQLPPLAALKSDDSQELPGMDEDLAMAADNA